MAVAGQRTPRCFGVAPSDTDMPPCPGEYHEVRWSVACIVFILGECDECDSALRLISRSVAHVQNEPFSYYLWIVLLSCRVQDVNMIHLEGRIGGYLRGPSYINHPRLHIDTRRMKASYENTREDAPLAFQVEYDPRFSVLTSPECQF
jgi:hypothetical protein